MSVAFMTTLRQLWLFAQCLFDVVKVTGSITGFVLLIIILKDQLRCPYNYPYKQH